MASGDNSNRNNSSSTTAKRLTFHCQLAHGSCMGFISNFSNVKELYQRIADCFDFQASEILFCTLNTHKTDMNRLLGGQLGLEDFIFVHIKGRAKEIELTKTEEALGLTITDNGAGRAFIKRIKDDSVASRTNYIHVGDNIESINGITCLGKRHFEVAKTLREIPVGANFVLRLVEPLKSGFSEIALSSRGGSTSKRKGNIQSGMKTLRLRATGPATVEVVDDIASAAVARINFLLELYLGISDDDMAQLIWEIGGKCDTAATFIRAVDAELADLDFATDFRFDLWTAVLDARAGRLDANGRLRCDDDDEGGAAPLFADLDDDVKLPAKMDPAPKDRYRLVF